MKKYISKSVIVCTLLLLLFFSIIYSIKLTRTPKDRPVITVKYEDKFVPSILWNNYWPAADNKSVYPEGNINILVPETSAFIAKPGDKIEVIFSVKPKHIRISQLSKSNSTASSGIYTGFKRKYTFNLPKEKGEYIYEIYGYWDDSHNTSDILKVRIQ